MLGKPGDQAHLFSAYISPKVVLRSHSFKYLLSVDASYIYISSPALSFEFHIFFFTSNHLVLFE